MAAVNARWTVCDPVHHILDFGNKAAIRDTVKHLVDTAPFQRLRRISQLGLAGHVFPGANHSRFVHCLGAAHLARSVVQQLWESANEHRRPELADYEQPTVAAALLHDIGHGPFSHAFEPVLKDIMQTKVSHEAWTRAIILGPLRPVLERHKLDAENLANSFFGASQGFPAYIRQIISSQLDVDRMDYLVRDAHFSGVPLGNIDLHYLIRSLTVIEHGADHATLGLTYKGVKAYEAFALSRHHMNRTVYYHAKVAVLELMMEKCLLEIRAEIGAGKQQCSGIPNSLYTLLSAKKADTVEAFLDANLDAYLDVTEDHVWCALGFVSRSWSGPASDLAQSLLERRLLPYFYAQAGKAGELKAILEHSGFDARDYCLRPKKSKVYSESADYDVVHVIGDDNRSRAVTSHSFTLTAFANRPEEETLLVVLDRSKTDKILKAARHCLRLPQARDVHDPTSGKAPHASDTTETSGARTDDQGVY